MTARDMAPPGWPVSGGEVANLIRSTDWTHRPPGPVATWSRCLRNTIELILPVDSQIALFWGPQFIAFYNDSYAPAIGNNHPRAFGQPAVENWAVLWDDLEPLLQRVLRTGETVSARDRLFRVERHGYLEDVNFDISYSPVRDDDGSIAGVLCLVAETTQRLRAAADREREEAARQAHQEELARVNASLEQRVRERTRDLDRIWRLSTDLMLVARLDGSVHAVNPAWHAQLGWSEAEVVGQPFTAFLHPDDIERSLEENARLATGLRSLRFENRWRHRDGSHRTIAWTAVPEGGLVHAVGRDTTAERAAAAALRETEDRLRQSQKMEAVGQLTGGIAHDFNNLLQGISGSLEVVRKRLAQGRASDVERFLTGAINATQRAAALTHRLLAFSRRQPLDPKPVRANPLVGSMEDLLRRTLGEQVALELALADDLWTTLCDPNQLEAAVLNLALNARDAMPSGGRLTVATANVVHARDPEAASGAGNHDFVRLSVTDTGTGMAPDVVARAFDPFFTTKPLGQGTGLGLSMIYGFALQSEGFCHIDSEPGAGTTVSLYLPRHADVPDAPAPLAAPLPVAGAPGGVVLVVEDESVVRALLVDLLGEWGYQVRQASDGPSALALLQGPEPVHLLLTDIGLPGLNGRQLAEAARQHRPALPVLLMTGYAEAAAQAHGFLGAGMALITKPFEMDVLAARVRAMMDA